MNVLSLFDGMSCGQIAFKKLGIEFDSADNKYFASEIKKHAIKVTQTNFPNTIQIGDIKKVWYKNGVLHTENGDFKVDIDVIIGGSPCQNLSIARTQGKKVREGLAGDKSGLFFEYLRVYKEVKPKHFLLENVVMPKEDEAIFTRLMKTEPVRINSRLVSFQQRDRLYWTNISNVTVPQDRNINFQDYKDIDTEYCRQFKVKKTPSRIKMWEGCCPNVTNREKINCLTVKQDRWNNAGLVEFEDFCRYLTVRECELAQTVPIGYTSCLNKNQAWDVLGDGWTVDVIAHIFNGLAEKELSETA